MCDSAKIDIQPQSARSIAASTSHEGDSNSSPGLVQIKAFRFDIPVTPGALDSWSSKPHPTFKEPDHELLNDDPRWVFVISNISYTKFTLRRFSFQVSARIRRLMATESAINLDHLGAPTPVDPGANVPLPERSVAESGTLEMCSIY